ncbi:lysylphosphatidylglycerol synthase transmembrane domain-containing protein [Candidatus Nitrospira salsa]|nr:MAG: TIGR00374 family protein [Nitrospirales bacterium]
MISPSVQEQGNATARYTMPSWLRFVISAALLATLLVYVDLADAWRIIRKAQVEPIAELLVVFLVLRFFSAYRWYVLLHGKNATITFIKVVRLTFTSLFIGTFMPGGIDLVRVYLLSKATSDLALAFSSMLVERVLALLALFSLVLFGLLASPAGLPTVVSYSAWVGLALLGLGCLTLMHHKLRDVINHVFIGQAFTPIRNRFTKLYTHLDAYANQPWLMVWSIVLAMAIQLLRVGCTVIGASALEIELPLMTFVVIVPIIFLVSLIPISIGGLGVREAAFISLLGLVGVQAEAAFSLSVIMYVVNLVTTLPGAFFYIMEREQPTN